MEKEEPRIPWVHLRQQAICQRSRVDRVYTAIYTDIKFDNKTNINHIMVSFTNHYNDISIDRLPSKTKIGKYSWYFNNSLLCKPKVSSATKTFLFLLRNTHKRNKYSCSVPPIFKSGSCRLGFSELFLCYKKNLPISNVNYVKKEY